MIDAPVAAASQEEPTFFEADGETLFGILSGPASEPTGTCVVIAPGGGTPSTSAGRNRMFAALARTLADLGCHAFRFDYHGVGDSTGEVLSFHVDRPFVADLRAAVSYVRSRGFSRLIVVGSCFGARTAMAAHQSIDGIEGMVLLAPPLRDFALSERKTEGWSAVDYLVAAIRPRRLVGGENRITARRYLRFLRSGARVVGRKLRSRLGGRSDKLEWVSRPFLDGVASLIERGIPVLLLYGADDEAYADFQEARSEELGKLLDRARDRIEVQVAPGTIHGFTSLDAQAAVVERVSDWITRVTTVHPSDQPTR